jgi:phosphoribosylanthranilate isomerase
MTAAPRVKICCITSIEEARLAINFGASALGLVSDMPSGPGVISEDKIAEIAAAVPPPIATFLLTSKTAVDEIIQQQKYCRTNTIQIVDRLTDGTYRNLKQALPGISIVQVIHVVSQESVQEAILISPEVDAILLDSGNQAAQIKELGGTGRVHNWEISRQINKRVSKPVYLAGGLHPGNIRLAIQTVHPFGIDVCSGVRTENALDRTKLYRFFKNIGKLPPPK